MNRLEYNISVGVGTALASAGAGWQYGVAVGLMVLGGLAILLTVIAAIIGAR